MSGDDRDGFATAGGTPSETKDTPPVRPEDWFAHNTGQQPARSPSLAAEEHDRTPLRRPTGTNLMAGAGFALAIGGLAAVTGVAADEVRTPGYPSIGIAPTYNTWKWPTIWIGGSLISLSVLLWSLGQIVRAIYFLPGREVTPKDLQG